MRSASPPRAVSIENGDVAGVAGFVRGLQIRRVPGSMRSRRVAVPVTGLRSRGLVLRGRRGPG